MPAANQYTDMTGYLSQRDARSMPIGASANAGYAMPNLDPLKMGTTDALARKSALTLPQYQAMQQDPQVAGAMQAGQATPGVQQPAGARTQSYDQFYGSPQAGQAQRDDVAFNDAGTQLAGRASGKRTSKDIEAEGLYAQQQRDQGSAASLRALQSRGFAPGSALGLDYQNLVDRQVAELMTRRQADQEKTAQGQYVEWLGQAETRRRNREAEALAQQQEQERKRQFDAELAYKKQHYVLDALGLLADKGIKGYSAYSKGTGA